jgi:hypothetical protein
MKSRWHGIAMVGLLASCQMRPPPQLVLPEEPQRFPHEPHTVVACTGCHQEGLRPGSHGHAPCLTCHAEQFALAAENVCSICHEPADATQAASAGPVKTFPPTSPRQHLPSRFSHAGHLQASAMEKSVGFHLDCADCHRRTRDATGLARPGHSTCSRCHAPEVQLAGAPSMEACDRCHGGEATLRSHVRWPQPDLHFDHRNHEVDRSGGLIGCRSCHRDVEAATTSSTLAPPHAQDCVGCHDDSQRVPDDMDMRACETCHRDRSASIGTLAPRSHLPQGEKPRDHTLAFRSDHHEPARREARRCATCHSEMSGSRVDSCDECHQVTRPGDHVVTWTELDHGGAALADSSRCATCHVTDQCSACHGQRPRSHLPPGSFLSSGHGPLARINVRACLTCHDPAQACDSCHAAMAPRGRM